MARRAKAPRQAVLPRKDPVERLRVTRNRIGQMPCRSGQAPSVPQLTPAWCSGSSVAGRCCVESQRARGFRAPVPPSLALRGLTWPGRGFRRASSGMCGIDRWLGRKPPDICGADGWAAPRAGGRVGLPLERGRRPTVTNGTRDESHVCWPRARKIGCKSATFCVCSGIRAMKGSRRSVASQEATEHADLQGVFYGSDGTRTRDLRRDRPALVMPVWAGIGGDYRCQQGFPTVVLRGSPGACGSLRRPPAG